MNSQIKKNCSSCAEVFFCGSARGEEKCWCENLRPYRPVSNDVRDCFCPKCLSRAIETFEKESAGHAKLPGGIRGAELVEGEDYYVEGMSIVFTADYHLRRGYCCDSGCRHCPYDKD